MTASHAPGPGASASWSDRLLRQNPVVAGLVLLLLTVALLSGSLLHTLPRMVVAAVGTGVSRPLPSMLTSALWCSGPAALGAAIAVAVLAAPAERRLGSRVTVVALLGGQLAGTAVGLVAIRLLALTGDTWARELAAMAVVGPLPGLLAVVAIGTARTSALWRRRLRLSVTIILVALVLYSGTTGDVLRLAGWGTGLAAGAAWIRARGQLLPRPHPSRREARALVALVVAMTAIGPLVAAVSRTPDGPWAVLSHLFVVERPDHALLRAVCGVGGDPADCRVLQARARLTGHGPALLSLLPVLVQLVLAEGLRRGRHAAWLAAVLFQAALTAVGAAIVLTSLRTPAGELTMLDVRPGSLPTVSVIAPVAAPLAVLVLLLLTRNACAVRAAPGVARAWSAAAGAGLAVIALGYLGLGLLLSRQWAQAPSPLALLTDLPWRMLPPGYLGEVLAPLVPRDEATRALADWTGVAAWAVLLITAVLFVRPAAPSGDALRARALVRRHGSGALSFMTTWVGNRYWFLPDGDSMVAYRVVGGVALTTGDPVGPPGELAAAVLGFDDFCEEHGWTPCWYSVTDDVLEALSGTGAQTLQVAAETWLPLGDLSFRGRSWQDVRTAMNRATREGVQARWITWSRAPRTLRDQIARLSEEWLAAKRLPEMGFTLGGLDELADDDVRCLVAVDTDGAVTALTSWLPAYRDGVPVGWTLDVMRRGRPACPGVMEFLIATAALTFQDEGAEWVSLSGAPLALPPGTADRGLLNRLLELAGRTMEPVYGFRSLLAFKAKFHPHYRPLWLACPEAADLPRVARAVSGAYLPHLSAGQAIRLVRALLHGHGGDRPHPSPPASPLPEHARR